jgi:raffinose/stachyose/melibiose transport system substrate-binding protein
MLKRNAMALWAAFAILLAACTGANPAGSASPAGPSSAGPSTSGAPAGSAGAADLTIESWRTDDLAIWQDKIIPAFNAKYPDIKITFSPTKPDEYNGVLNTKLQGGTAGDLITCRPFDASLQLFKDGNLAALKDVFCVPMASVIHGFIYNTDAFAKLSVTAAPTTVEEFHALLDKFKTDGTYTPLAMGTKELWESATMGFQNIGPNYWKGEEGRKALIDGTAKFTDQPYVDTWAELASWKPYLPSGYEAIAYADAQQYFASGKAAIYPAGSWDIAYFEGQGVKIGFFGPPLPKAGDTCYISDHTDIALGMNAKTTHPAEAKTFLDWVASDEFATLYSNALPGFYSLSNNAVKIDDAIAQQAVDLRKSCKSTIRNSYQILSRGEPNLENELWRVTAAVMNGTLTPQKAGEEIQAGLDKWYKPAGD